MYRYLLILFLLHLTSRVSAQSEAFLQKHFEAMGQELWNQINDVTIDGRWVDEEYHGYQIKLSYKAPDNIRIDGTYENVSFTETCTSLDCWIKAPWKDQTLMDMSAVEATVLRNSFVKGSALFAVKSKIEAKGLQDMEGRLYLTYSYENEDLSKTFYIDSTDYKIYYEEIYLKDSAYMILKVYEKYRSFNGLNVPAAIIFEGDELEKEIVYDQLYFGLGISDNLFKRPNGQ